MVFSSPNARFISQLLMIVTLMGVTIFFRQKLDVHQSDDFRIVAPPPPGLKYYSFGFHESLADGLWLRYVQDIDRCRVAGKSEITRTGCVKGWGYQMLDAITDLAPKFRMPFAVGPISLSVINSDIEGSTALFEKAIRAFPKDWSILYKAAYHFLEEKGDQTRAAHLLLQAYQNGGPEWLPLLASKLYNRTGQLELGISTLSSYVNLVKDPNIRRRVERRLARLICERDALSMGKTFNQNDCKSESED